MPYTDPLQSTLIGRRALSYLDAASLARCSCVCVKWNKWVFGKKNCRIMKDENSEDNDDSANNSNNNSNRNLNRNRGTSVSYVSNEVLLPKSSESEIGNITIPRDIVRNTTQKHVRIDNDPYISVLPPVKKALFKWRIQLSGIPAEYRYKYWRYVTELEMQQDSNIMHRQPGIFELFVDQLPPPSLYKTINDDISFYTFSILLFLFL